MKKLFLFILLIMVCVVPVFGKEIIINSKEWKDVYSGMQYGYLTETQPRFLTSEIHSTLILNDIIKQDLMLFSSKKSPFVVGYEAIVESEGFGAEEIVFKDLSLELADRLETISNFIILDDTYGYNAIAVAPYAIVSKSFVLFANEDNIDDVYDVISSRDNPSVLIYGRVDRAVKSTLEEFTPEIIDNNGDRFADNVEIVKKFKEIDDTRQVLLSNGEFIESEIMAGNYPVLFIGIDNVPDKIKEYIVSSNIESGVLIGNELVNTATVVRRQTGISTFVKFARSSRQPEGAISQVEGLDVFRLPKYELSIELESARYNTLTRQLEVTIKNTGELAAYYKGTYSIKYDGEEQTIGDVNAIFLDGLETKTLSYEVDPIDADSINLKALILFGESSNSLERMLETELEVQTVNINDNSNVIINYLEYSISDKGFYVYVENIGTEEVFIDSEIIEVIYNGAEQSFGADEIISVMPGKTGKSFVGVELSEEDILENDELNVRVYYGQRENALVKFTEGDFEFKVIKDNNIVTYVLLAVIVVILILLLKRRKDKKGNK